ncbi:glycosyltransferase family 2 protein [Clostridium perfringens]|uniref:glycosyltransferase family 2 protein n=1 Tax=Clostridium perfringens TaxID=1502 RepID=UPI0018E4C595|nr:glycosyltransferase family 2 protein [Clostridium perfringens]MBI5989773.1 glycosyltransferase family 2 protein [Clostridium perfringens]MDM0995607.1 glycosyltransferase family 2 protein [Clostridium perfringens]MDM1015778.1 glycosyltransferase family 2 protein [Clostridium perfringens]MDM1016896.1 glycosyltransferase family 2 protein [Clostridium perfringens]
MLSSNPLVSVIIPTYKRSDMLVDAIESVKNQTYKNIEIIVIDDNGINSKYTKENKLKLKNYIESNDIKYIQNKDNIGGALSRNIGVNEALGKYIAFLDDDDTYMPTKIEKQVKLIEENIKNGVGLVYCYCNGVDEFGNIIWENTNSYSGLPLYESMIYCIASTSLWLCDRKMLLDIGGFEDMPSKQDLLLMVRIITNGYKILCVEEKLVNYLEHSREKISSNRPKQSIVDGWNILRNYCRKSYFKLDNNLIKDVEYRFARTLCLQYIGLNNKNMALNEYKLMLKNKSFSRGNLSMLYRIIFGFKEKNLCQK